MSKCKKPPALPEVSFKKESIMDFYLAPMEGITGVYFRRALEECGFGADKYFTPFLEPNQTKSFKTKEKKEADPEANRGMYTVPQLMAKNAEHFLWGVSKMAELGYREVNLNLGCPSPTVVSRGRGAGFLKDTEALDAFFRAVFEGMPAIEEIYGRVGLTVKTRLGYSDPGEMKTLLEIYNRYPLSELIVHARVREQYYSGKPDLDTFEYICKNSLHPLCYNGDIVSAGDFQAFRKRFPGVDRIMIGRGVVANPSLFRILRGGNNCTNSEFEKFHDLVFQYGSESLGGANNAVWKMKEIWSHAGSGFENADVYLKRIRKAKRAEEYLSAARDLMRNCKRI